MLLIRCQAGAYYIIKLACDEGVPEAEEMAQLENARLASVRTRVQSLAPM